MHWSTNEDTVGSNKVRKLFRIKLEQGTPLEKSLAETDLMKNIVIYPNGEEFIQTRVAFTKGKYKKIVKMYITRH